MLAWLAQPGECSILKTAGCELQDAFTNREQLLSQYSGKLD
jgi:hypothetical protein